MTSNHLPEWQQHTPVINKTIEFPLRSSGGRKTRKIRQLRIASCNLRKKMRTYIFHKNAASDFKTHTHLSTWLSNISFAYGHFYRILKLLYICVGRSCRARTTSGSIGVSVDEKHWKLAAAAAAAERTLQGLYGSAGNKYGLERAPAAAPLRKVCFSDTQREWMSPRCGEQHKMSCTLANQPPSVQLILTYLSSFHHERCLMADLWLVNCFHTSHNSKELFK